jgi:hypothetical protein
MSARGKEREVKPGRLILLGAGTAALIAGGAAYLGWIPGTNGEQIAAAGRCGRCGVVEAVREVGHGRGVSSQAMAGVAIAQQLGGFSHIANVLTLLVFAASHRSHEPGIAPPVLYETTVRFADGTARTLVEVNPPARAPGQPVKVISGRIHAVPAPAPVAAAFR